MSFRFKQFTIRQDHCAMKVGTDGVLFGAWASARNAKQILDIGTGTGLIALMLAQRFAKAEIDAIEIEENAYRQAAENVECSPFADRIRVIHSSLQTFLPDKKYNLVVSNPPYFSQSLKNPDASKSLARHDDTLSPKELLEHGKRLLHAGGKLSLIFPVSGFDLLKKHVDETGFYFSHITKVFPKTGAGAKRLLLELSLLETSCYEDEFYIEKQTRHEYSDQYKTLTKDFYLNF